jgi:hypothetical protein
MALLRAIRAAPQWTSYVFLFDNLKDANQFILIIYQFEDLP